MTNKNRASGPQKPDAPFPQKTHDTIFPENAEFAKRYSTIRAELALLGYACRRVEFGGYFVTNESATFYCREMRDLEIVLEGLQS